MVLNTSTWQLFATYQTGHKKGHRWSTSTWHYNIFVYALIYAFIYSCTWVKEKLHWNSYTNFISEVINIDFRQIWHFDMKGTGWVGLERCIIFTQTMWSFDMWVVPYTGILKLAKLNISYIKTYVLRHYKVSLLLITQRDIQSVEQGISSAKVKPDRPIQNFD